MPTSLSALGRNHHIRSFYEGASAACTMLERALALAENGFAVFPCGKDKTPCIPKEEGGQGFRDATRDPRQICEWWERWPKAKIGIWPAACDPPLVVLDIDVKNGARGEESARELAAEGLLPPTFAVKTPSGGEHRIYQLPEGAPPPGNRQLAPGIDVRSANGYIVWWHDGPPPDQFEITQVSATLAARFIAAKERDKNAGEWLVEPDLPANVARAELFLAGTEPAIEGVENERGVTGGKWTLLTAECLRDFGISEGKALELMAGDWNERCEPPWDLEDLARQIGNAYRYAERPAGNKVALPPEMKAIAEANKAKGAGKAEVPTDTRKTDARKRFPIIRGADAIKKPVAGRYLVSRLIPDASVGLVYGDWGTFKTFVLVYVAASWALGREVLGRRSHHSRRVAYIAAEGSTGVRRRLAGFAHKHGLSSDDVKVDVIPTAPQLLDKDDLDALILSLEGEGYGLVVVDTISKATVGLDDHTRQDTSRVLAACSSIQRALGVTVIGVEHANKRGELSGSNNKGAGVDFLFLTKRADDLTARLECEKLKDEEPPAPTYLRAEKIRLADWPDEEGQPLTTLVFDHDPHTDAEAEAKRKSAMEKVYWYVRVADEVERIAKGKHSRDPSHPINECLRSDVVGALRGHKGYSEKTLQRRLRPEENCEAGGRTVTQELRENPRGGHSVPWIVVRPGRGEQS